jgi:hypothetical protein
MMKIIKEGDEYGNPDDSCLHYPIGQEHPGIW